MTLDKCYVFLNIVFLFDHIKRFMFKTIILTFLGCPFFVGLFAFPKGSPWETVHGIGVETREGTASRTGDKEGLDVGAGGGRAAAPPRSSRASRQC